VSCRRLRRNFSGLTARAPGPRRLNTRRLVGAARIAAWIEPLASLPKWDAEHSDDDAPLRPQADEQSLDLDGQLLALEISQTLCGWQ
jgi:hypothetical protein